MKKYDDGKVIIKTVLILVFVLFISGYALFQSKNLIKGPKITLTDGYSGVVVVNNDILRLSGTAKNIASITLDDRPITIDEQGLFNEVILLFPGINTVKLFGKDKFGASTEKRIQVIYKI